MMQPADGLSQTMESSGATTGQDGHLFRCLSISHWTGDPSEGWTLGTVALQLRQTPKGLTAEDSVLTLLPAAGAMSPSLTWELDSVVPGPEC